MTVSVNAVDRDTLLMPPPARVYRMGTPACIEALDAGFLRLSNIDPDEIVPQLARTVSYHASSFSSHSEEQEDAETCPLNQDGSREDRTSSAQPMELTEDRRQSLFLHDYDQECENSDKEENISIEESVEEEAPLKAFDSVAVRLEDIVGHRDVKVRIEELLLPLTLPCSFADAIFTGVRALPASILLYGPPGCGKTQLARAVAGEAGAAFLPIGPSDVLSKYVGDSESTLRGIFQKAFRLADQMESQCTVIFFDEIDALGQPRGLSNDSGQGGEGDVSSRRILAELLIQLNDISGSKRGMLNRQNVSNDGKNEGEPHGDLDVDSRCHEEQTGSHLVGGSSKRARVIVVAATNRKGDLDPALIRRFGLRLYVGLPSKKDRKRILGRLLKEVSHRITNADLRDLAIATDGYSGSGLESVSREAIMAPVRECIHATAKQRRRMRKRELEVEAAAGKSIDKRSKLATDCLLARLSTMRPVIKRDFNNAFQFWSENVQAERAFSDVNYESSSDSDEDF